MQSSPSQAGKFKGQSSSGDELAKEASFGKESCLLIVYVGSHLSDFFARASDASASFAFVGLRIMNTNVLEPTRMRVGTTVRTNSNENKNSLLVEKRPSLAQEEDEGVGRNATAASKYWALRSPRYFPS